MCWEKGNWRATENHFNGIHTQIWLAIKKYFGNFYCGRNWAIKAAHEIAYSPHIAVLFRIRFREYILMLSYLRAVFVIKRPSVEMRFSGLHGYAISFSMKCVLRTQVRHCFHFSAPAKGVRVEISICRTARFGNQQIGSHRTPHIRLSLIYRVSEQGLCASCTGEIEIAREIKLLDTFSDPTIRSTIFTLRRKNFCV